MGDIDLAVRWLPWRNKSSHRHCDWHHAPQSMPFVPATIVVHCILSRRRNIEWVRDWNSTQSWWTVMHSMARSDHIVFGCFLRLDTVDSVEGPPGMDRCSDCIEHNRIGSFRSNHRHAFDTGIQKDSRCYRHRNNRLRFLLPCPRLCNPRTRHYVVIFPCYYWHPVSQSFDSTYFLQGNRTPRNDRCWFRSKTVRRKPRTQSLDRAIESKPRKDASSKEYKSIFLMCWCRFEASFEANKKTHGRTRS